MTEASNLVGIIRKGIMFYYCITSIHVKKLSNFINVLNQEADTEGNDEEGVAKIALSAL